MFGLKKPDLNEKFVKDTSAELISINREIEKLKGKVENLQDLYESLRGRTNRTKKPEEDLTEEKPKSIFF